MEEIKFCPHCGHANKGTSTFCEKCGTRLAGEDGLSNDNDFLSNTKNESQSIHETPIVEKTKYTILNYSQVLRRNIYLNPYTLISRIIFFLITLTALILNKVLPQATTESDGIDYVFLANFFFILLALLWLFDFLILTPLKMISKSKKCEVQNYHLSFFRNSFRYEFTMIYMQQLVRNDFIVKYEDLCKVKEFKDMMILVFNTHGQLFPLCLLKDDNYPKIISLMQSKINQITKNK